jgi:antirestriction protein ArdC
MGVFSEIPLGGGRETERRESKLLIETIAIEASKKYLQNPRKLSCFFKVQLWLQILEALTRRNGSRTPYKSILPPLRSIVNDNPIRTTSLRFVRQFSGVDCKGELHSKSHPKRSTRQMQNHANQSPSIPKWSALLIEAVTKPGLIMKAYSAFHQYSVGNQILALVQCQMRGLQPGPINTFPKWKDLGRFVKRGERALSLCMPITCKRREKDSDEDHTFTSFVYKARWFVLSQTDGQELEPVTVPQWDAQRAISALGIERIPFDHTDGNVQGFARKRQVAINPLAQLPYKTLFHELGHVLLGHTTEADFADAETTPRSLREVEAESVALLCCESLGLEGAEFCRGYIQNWVRRGSGFNAEAIPEKSAQKIFRVADQIIRAGRSETDTVTA